MSKFVQIRTQGASRSDLEHPSDRGHHTDDRWDILTDIVIAKDIYGLTSQDITVLRALMTFLPKGHQPHMIVFPSNRTITERTEGMHPRTIARHLKALVEAGMIERRQSPNGKRYRKRNGDSGFAHVFGLDLMSCFKRRDEIHDTADACREQTMRIAFLREELSLIRAQLVTMSLAPEICDEIRKIMRRVPDLMALEVLRSEALIALPCPSVADNLTVIDRQNVCHQQRSNKDYNDSDQRKLMTVVSEANAVTCNETSDDGDDTNDANTMPELFDLVESCPNATFVAQSPIRTWPDVHRLSWQLSSMLGINQDLMLKATEALGKDGLAVTILCLCQKSESIRSYGGYLRSLCAKAESFKPATFLRQVKRGALAAASARHHVGSDILC